jgi:D-inositol-3-phosphate glycosyltransferase
MRRIAFLSEHASPLALLGGQDAGGQNVYVDEVSRNLARLGLEVDVFTRRDDPTQPEVVRWAPGVRIVHLDAGPARFLLKDDLWRYMPDFRASFLRFAARDGAGYDLIHGNFWMSGWVATELRRRVGLPAVQIFHAMGKTKQRHQGTADTSPDGRIAVEMQIVREVDALIAQCPSERDELVGDYDADPEKVHVVPSAVNIETFRPVPRDEARRRIGLPMEGLVVAYVGRMLPRKDVRNLVRAVALLPERHPEVPPVTLLLVGGETAAPDPAATPELGVLMRLAEELGIRERVRFAGKRQPEMLRNYYSAGNVVVTTPWYEPFGLTPLEAMACGRPVIGSAVGGIGFTVKDGETGFLVPPRAPEVLAERLAYLLARPDVQRRMGRAARDRVEREFTWKTVARRTASLYDAVLAARPRELASMTPASDSERAEV